MATTQKTERLIDHVSDLLKFKFGASSVGKFYDASSDVYLKLSSGGTLLAIVKFEPEGYQANDISNPVTGLTGRRFVPDRCRVGFDLGTPASGTITAAAPDGAGALSQATLTLSGVVATDTITINGVAYVADTGFAVGVDDAATATNLAAAINADTTAGVLHVVAVAAAGVVTLYYTLPGTGFNTTAITDSTNGAGNHFGGNTTFAGGTAGNIVAINGQSYESVKHADYVAVQATGSTKAADEGLGTHYFDESTTDILQAANLAATINASTDINAVVRAVASGADVAVTALVSGASGNLITLTETGAFTVTGTGTLSGGVDGTASAAVQAYVAATVALCGTEVDFYAKSGIAVGDLVQDNWYQNFRDSWGFINHQ